MFLKGIFFILGNSDRMAANDRRIFVGDLPPQVRISDIHHFFKNCGKIWDVYLDKNNSRYAFVVSENPFFILNKPGLYRLRAVFSNSTEWTTHARQLDGLTEKNC